MISINLKFCRRELALTQAQMAEKLGIKRSLVGAYEEGRAEPRLATLVNMSRLFGITLDQLVTTDFSKKKNAKVIGSLPSLGPVTVGDPAAEAADEAPAPAPGRLRILALTVDKDQNENIELVPQKASAGYLNGYADPEYLEVLPKFRLPMLSQSGTYRAFEIAGDSMLPIVSGTVIVGRYVEEWTSIKDGTPCVVVSSKDGIVFKRLFSKLRSQAMFALHSDNPIFSPYDINVDDILEIWEAKSYISSTFPIAELSLERVASLVLDLQQQVALLKKV